MGRPENLKPLPSHPAVGTTMERREKYGRRWVCLRVTCPHCGAERWYPMATLRQQMKRSNFNGQCLSCSLKMGREGYFKWLRANGTGRRLLKNGYVALSPTAIDLADLPLFRAMMNRNHSVFEHRFVMAKHLGRALTRHECVDHMDGNRANNEPLNLRLYRRGNNDPGSCPGYGTYYHELQIALARIRELEQLIP